MHMELFDPMLVALSGLAFVDSAREVVVYGKFTVGLRSPGRIGWRQYSPMRKRLILTVGSIALTRIAVITAFVVAAFTTLYGPAMIVGWAAYGLSYSLMTTMPFCEAGRKSRRLRILRHIAYGIMVAGSLAVLLAVALHGS